MPSDFVFEGDLARATTLPADWYLGEASRARDEKRIFARTWQLVGHASQVAKPGDYFTCEVAGEPLVVARGSDGALRALSNVCRHRAGPVASGAGHRKTLQCGYHGWTYELDGRLRTTPEFEGVEGFEPASVCLPSVRADVFGPLVFVTLDAEAPPLLDVLGPIAAETAHRGLEQMHPYRRRDWELACNWKVYVDNYLEGYHIPIVHQGLRQLLDYSAYRVETGRWHSKQHAPLRRSVADSLDQRHRTQGNEPEALYYWVFPNLMFNFYPDNLQLNVILPLGPERTLTRFEWFVAEPERPGLSEELERSLAVAEQVQREDVAICESVQRGLRSRFYERGRFSVARENGVHHFHGLVAEYVAEDVKRSG